MVRITEDLVRKKAEHNEMEIHSLEELSLHQQEVEKIEFLNKWCRELKILYLQSNLIPKIENVGRLKKLEYLNLALNNVELIENLEGCESLKKLDLTLNFVSEITSIESLRSNQFFEEIYLTGNPCVNFEGYRQYVIAALPQLTRLDGQEIEKSERIQACQVFDDVRLKILQQQKEYNLNKSDEKKWSKDDDSDGDDDEIEELSLEDEEAKNAEFWNSKCEYTPETRKEMQKKMKKNREKKTKPMFEKQAIKRERRYFNAAGDPMNTNEGKIDFTLTENDDDSAFILDVTCYKFLDTSLIDVDVQPKYVRVNLKGQIIQLVLYEEVKTGESKAQRSLTTGHLVVTMPKLNPPPKPVKTKEITQTKENLIENQKNDEKFSKTKRETLEFDSSKSLQNTLANIAKDGKLSKKKFLSSKKVEKVEINSPDFVDDPDVPPLV